MGSPTRCRSPAPRSSPACSSPGCWPRAGPGWGSRRAAATTPSACSPPRGPMSAGCTAGSRCAGPSAWKRGRSPCRATSPRLPSSSSPPCSCPVVRSPSRGSGPTRPAPACWASSSGWAPRSSSRLRASAAASRWARCGTRLGAAAASRSAATRFRWRSTSCPWLRSPPALPRARRRSATRPSCAARSPTASPPPARR